MAISFMTRTLITKPALKSLFTRSFTSNSPSLVSRSSSLLRLRPLVALTDFSRFTFGLSQRCLLSPPAVSLVNDSSPNWNNRPPKETIVLEGCDFEHWLIIMQKPEGEPTRDEIIDSYIQTLAKVVGSEEEARKSIYSVSTKHYFAFGCIVSEEVSYKIKELPRVSWVLPDSYLDAKNRDYGGEPFLNGQTVPYNPKYHEDWVRNNARTNDSRSKRDRPRNFDRSRNSERSDNMQNRDFQGSNGDASPTLNTTQNNRPHLGGPPPYANQNSGPNTGGPTPYANQNSVPNMGVPPSYANHQSNGPNVGGMPPYPSQHNNRPIGTIIPNRPNSGYANISGNMEALPNREFGPKTGFSNTMPNKDFQPRGGSTVPMSNGGDMPYQSREVPTQKYNNYNGNKDNGGAGMASGNACQVRDLPGQDF